MLWISISLMFKVNLNQKEIHILSLDKTISAVGKQVISLPLTFAATGFASYKIKDQGTVLLFILIAYLAYSSIAFFILKVSSFNIKCLREDVTEEEYIKISYSNLYPDFKSDVIKI